MREAGRDAALDGIRGLAALGVCVLHVAGNTGTMYTDGMVAWMTSRLGLAVPIFFLLSGLLLYRPWARAALEGAEPPGTGRYLLRRMLRVMPAYCLVTGLVLWAWSSLDAGGRLRWMLMLQNYVEDGEQPEGLYQMWTMPIELAFYVSLPVLAWALGRFARGDARRLLAGIAVLPVISVATVLFSHWYGEPRTALWLPHHLIYFGAGMALAVLSVTLKDRRVVDALAPQALVTAFLLFCVLSTELAGPRQLELPTLAQSLWRMGLEAAIAVLVVAPFALAGDRTRLPHRLLANPVTAYFGRISYSFFLWHAAVIAFYYKATGTARFDGSFLLVFAFAFTFTTLASAVTYHLVELPALRLVRPRPGRAREPEAAAAATPP
ncbi:acyltransferase family protein [Thermoactinospora rubra]|uniref:acyltransferase family protein n=1 Tax=Thermoactinospora rubra TaxID=1088767 RepID=UPI001301EC08|nr:acyltransferase [Thermoactinospora rubra]